MDDYSIIGKVGPSTCDARTKFTEVDHPNMTFEESLIFNSTSVKFDNNFDLTKED